MPAGLLPPAFDLPAPAFLFFLWSAIFTPMPETIALLEEIRGRCRLMLISNTNALHFAYLAQHAPFIFLFDDRILSFRVGLRKPDPAIFRHALDLAGARAEETLCIDDRIENIAAAEALGVPRPDSRTNCSLDFATRSKL
jgi:putative hydrolase of the HAD superfamily